MSKQHIAVLVALFAVIIVAIFVTTHFVNKKEAQIDTNTQKIFAGTENALTYTDINGNPVSLENYLGKILVVTTWASWSPFSEADMQNMDSLANEFSSDQVVFLAINRKETRDQAQRFVSSMPNFNNLVFIIDQEDFFYKSVDGYAMPESVIFDARGIIIDHTRGVFNKEKAKSIIEASLNQSS